MTSAIRSGLLSMSHHSSDRRLPSGSVSEFKFKVDSRPTRKLSYRVNTFRIEVDDEAFRELEYDRRRLHWYRTKVSFREDRLVQRWKKLYIPAFLLFIVGCLLLLLSSIDGLANDSVFRYNSTPFQVAGGVVTGFGFLLLTISVICSHRREDYLRLKSKSPVCSESKLEKGSKNEVDEYPRFTSTDSGCPESPVESMTESCRSTHSVYQWIANHKSVFTVSGKNLRRMYSDTALNQNYSKARLVAWQHNYPGVRMTECDELKSELLKKNVLSRLVSV